MHEMAAFGYSKKYALGGMQNDMPFGKLKVTPGKVSFWESVNFL